MCNSKKLTLKKEANNKKLEAIGSLTIRTKKKEEEPSKEDKGVKKLRIKISLKYQY